MRITFGEEVSSLPPHDPSPLLSSLKREMLGFLPFAFILSSAIPYYPFVLSLYPQWKLRLGLELQPVL